VGITPSQPVESTPAGKVFVLPGSIDLVLFEELWRECGKGAFGLTREEFSAILIRAGTTQDYGMSPDLLAGSPPSTQQQATFYHGLKLADLVLAQACAQGNERAWEHFLALYRQPLERAAIAITGGVSLGRDLADQLYAELYGMTTKDGQRRCPLDSYRGRGSLIGWLRTTLAQRHVDHHRRTHREQPIKEMHEFEAPPLDSELENSDSELSLLGKAIAAALAERQPEERFLLATYYLDGRTLFQIGQVLHVHEATISRKLRRVVEDLRKQVLKRLQTLGMSKRAAEEALGTDPRDLDINLKKLLQTSQSDAFQEKAAQ
jgi:RNA polymerase sigma-70 factor (ECF subfamily)